MDDTYEAAASPGRGAWTQHHVAGLGSPRMPYSARRTLAITTPASPQPMSSGISSPGSPMPPTPQSVQSSLLALEARSNSSSGNAHPMRQQKHKHLRLDIGAEDKWRRLGARVLPVFNGDAVVGAVEENAEIVRSCLRSDADAAWPEVHAVLRVGMTSLVRSLYLHVGVAPQFEPPADRTLKAVLSIGGVVATDQVHVLVAALAAVWTTMFSHVLPYLEGVFLPLAQFNIGGAGPARSLPAKPIGIRHVALVHFRDAVALPLLGRIDDAVVLARAQGAAGCPGDPWAYYQGLSAILHMLTVLAALTPGDRGHLYDTARALSLALQT
ncbi:hypothetical protein GGI22_003538 [Coemansia erecta]|nr:hypothetical protein GGI22_003538 [Coemansia erecta]